MTRPQRAVRHRRRYPLAVLFLCVGMYAVLAAMARQAVSQRIPAMELLAAATVGGLMGLILGVAAGIHQAEPARSASLGGVHGFFVGLLVGPIFLLNNSEMARGAAAAGAGMVVLVAFAVVARLMGRTVLDQAPCGDAPEDSSAAALSDGHPATSGER